MNYSFGRLTTGNELMIGSGGFVSGERPRDKIEYRISIECVYVFTSTLFYYKKNLKNLNIIIKFIAIFSIMQIIQFDSYNVVD